MDRQIGRQIDRKMDRQIVRLVDTSLVVKEIHQYRSKDRQIGREKDRWIDTQMKKIQLVRKVDSGIDRYIDRQ